MRLPADVTQWTQTQLNNYILQYALVDIASLSAETQATLRIAAQLRYNQTLN